ncbi:hypothetical protein EYZ11_011545 [Aspergillus tanneri]|uniref:Extracellular membrane protein CFEM domain-containing protein n=1 Tax=Aspergillus tanneri TaxID=1220188 RepID=A0A4V3UMX7_9EURO|nr:uncharacterized protein ATNIH1004_003905 [Aspergillus tanneri]KAA8648022.1 hypothetical protein ATNIH1004_003905 [Aspergillus tanneri]THC89004.1 hypothetical protein EYZ11_011545 [Aspergillus tanneri]
MRFSTVAAFACVVISAAAFEYPDFVPLHRRQEPGTPAYDCHANCGGVIVSARSDGFCDSSTFKQQLSDCLKCANEFKIWKYYGSAVSKAAKSCGLDSTPEDGSSTTMQASTSSAAEKETTTSEAQTSAASGSIVTSTVHSIATTASVTGSSHGVIPIPPQSATVSGSMTPSGKTTASTSTASSSIPLSNSAPNSHGSVWVEALVGSFAAMGMAL